MKISVAILLLIVTFSVGTGHLKAQNNSADSLSVAAELPKELRSGKSLMIVDPLPDPQDQRLRGEWMPIAEEAQPFMKRSGIDVVAAYHMGDIQSGPETEKALLQAFDDRNITHLVFIKQNPSNFVIRVAAFDKNSMIDPKIPVWETSAPDLSQALNQLYRAATNSGQELRNLLILNNALPGKLITPINGRRSEFYDLNLQSDKLAVLPFADTAMIRQTMAYYPYKYEIVDPSRDERQLRSDGFQFILYFVHTTGESVREILDYDTDPNQESYESISFRDNQPYTLSFDKDLPVYKFYIKHIYSGNVFLGKTYDAAPDWQQSLTMYIANLRKELMGN